MAKANGIKFPADKVERWNLDKLRPFEKNPRVHSDQQVELIANAIKEWGWTSPVLADPTGEILAGHGRVLAARKLGMKDVPVIIARGWTAEQKRAYVIWDNNATLQSSWDDSLLRENIEALQLADFDMALVGYDEAALALLATPYAPEPEPEEAVPEPPKNPITKRGDVWTLGRHRVVCGDSRELADVKLAMAGRLINLAFTSPPYAEQRDYDKSSGFVPIRPDNYVEWFKPIAENVAACLAPDGSWFVNIKPSADGLDTELYVMDLVIAHVRSWGWHFATEYCWERNGVPKSVTRRFKNQFEPIYQFARGEWKMRPRAVMHESDDVPIPFGPGAGQTSRKSAQGGNGPMFGKRRGRSLGVGPTTASKLQGQPGVYARDVKKRGFPTSENSQGTDWQKGAPLGIPVEQIGAGLAYPGNRLPTFASSHSATGHAAAFPVGLPEFFILAYTDPGDAVFDPFLGSGSTLMAAEKSDRVGIGLEISPGYVDVVIQRWQTFTGQQATLDGRTLEQVAKARRKGRPNGETDAADAPPAPAPASFQG